MVSSTPKALGSADLARHLSCILQTLRGTGYSGAPHQPRSELHTWGGDAHFRKPCPGSPPLGEPDLGVGSGLRSWVSNLQTVGHKARVTQPLGAIEERLLNGV